MARIFKRFLAGFDHHVVDGSHLPPVERPASKNDALELVFAPDVTGWPSSSLALYLNDKTRPELKEWIEKNLKVPDGSRVAGVDDETAMETIAPRSAQYGTEKNAYRERLKEFIKSRLPQSEEVE